MVPTLVEIFNFFCVLVVYRTYTGITPGIIFSYAITHANKCAIQSWHSAIKLCILPGEVSSITRELLSPSPASVKADINTV